MQAEKSGARPASCRTVSFILEVVIVVGYPVDAMLVQPMRLQKLFRA